MKKFAIALALCLGTAAAAHAEIRYSITGVGTADGYADNIWAINSSGAVTGSFMAGGTQEAFVFNGTVTRLGTGGASISLGRTINDKGVVGGIFGTGAEAKPFLFDGSTTLDLTTVNADFGGTGVMDLNNKGEALLYGFYIQQVPFVQPVLKNFVYDGSSTIDLQAMDSSKVSLTLNDVGGFGGFINTLPGGPFVFDGTDATSLPNIAAVGPAAALALNESGWATGITNMGNGFHAFLYNGTDTIDLGSLGSIAPGFSYGHALNSFGTVVGYSSYQPGPTHAFIYGSAGMEDLNSFIDPSSGWLLTSAQGINDAGQIVGVGIFNGHQRGFVLNPLAAVPEPASWAMMIAGFAIVGAGLRRKASLSIGYAFA